MESGESIRERPSRNWKPFVILVGCISILALAAIYTASWQERSEQARIRAEIETNLNAIRAAGAPMTAQDLAKLYPDPPPEHDAVLLLKPALEALAVPEDSTNLPFFSYSDAELPEGTAPIEKPMHDEIKMWMDRNQPAFDAVSLELLKDSWIGCSFTNGFTNLVYAPVSKINALSKLLCLNAVLEAELEHPKEAIQSLEKAAAIGNAWRNDLFIHGMVKLTAQSFVCRSLKRVLNRTPITDVDLIALSEFLKSTNLGVIKEALLNERSYSLVAADQLRSFSRQAKDRARTIYRDEDLLDYLESDQACISTLDLPLSNSIPAIAEMNRKSDESQKKEQVGFLNKIRKKRSSLLAVIGQPQRLAKSIRGEAETVALVRIARTAIAVERWRLAHNSQLPDSLEILVPDFLSTVPLDPFDNQPLRYKKLSRGYSVYSIGPDFTDDGGKEEPAQARKGNHYDITFAVER